MEEMGQQLRQMFANLGGGKTHKRKLTIRAARPQLIEDEAGKLVNEDDVREAAYWWMLEYNEERPHDSLGDMTPLEYRQTAEGSTFEMSA